MRIAIDGRTIESKTTGIGQYARHLVKCLLKIDRKNEYFLFLIERNDDMEAPNLTKILAEGYERMVLNRVWENFLLPTYVRRYAIDLYFSPAYALPWLPRFGKSLRPLPLPHTVKSFVNAERKLKYVVTIHDLIAYIHPEYFTPKMRMWQHFFTPNAIKLADKIISVSENTKRDLIRLFSADENRIVVIDPWFDEKYSPVRDEQLLRKVRDRYRLRKKFILYLGTIEPRKNILGLAQAYAQLPIELQMEFDLVIGGRLGWYAKDILAKINGLQTRGEIRLVDYVEHDHLPALYSLASVFVFPTFYEGFGSPPLEAMACGTPVITSRNSSLPDVVGDAALLINPNDVGEISEAIAKLLTDPELRSSLQAKGFERMKRYDWRHNAERTLAVFESLAT